MAAKKTAKKAEPKSERKSILPDPEEYVEIELFADNDKYSDDVVVTVNGERCQIQRGVPVKVKRKFAEVLQHSEEQRRSTQMLIKELTSKSRAAELQ